MIQKFIRWAAVQLIILGWLPYPVTTIKIRFKAGRDYLEKTYVITK